MTSYKLTKGKEEILALYDKQLKRLKKYKAPMILMAEEKQMSIDFYGKENEESI